MSIQYESVPSIDSGSNADTEELDSCDEQESSADCKSSSCHAAWNLFNMVEGTGILGLPYAVKEGGVVVLVGLALLAIISNYTGQIIITCLYETKKEACDKDVNENVNKPRRLRKTYEDIGQACFPRFGGKIVVVVQILELMFVCTLYLVLSGTLLIHTFPSYPISERGWIAISALVVLPTVFLQHLSHVAWFSLFSSVALLITITAVTVFGIHVSERWDIESIDICNIQTFPVGIGIVLFSYAAHPLLPGIEESLKNKSKFSFIMNMTFFLAAVTKILFSMTAYLSFSAKTQEVITNNLPTGVFRTVGCVLLVVNVLFSYAFPMFTVIHCITTSVLSKCCLTDSNYCQMGFLIALRIGLVMITLFSALLIPHFALLMSFIGNFTGTFLIFVFPALFHLKLFKGELRLWQIALDVTIIIFGISAGIVGVYTSGYTLIKAYIA